MLQISLAHLLKETAEESENSVKKGTVVLDATWAEAYFLKGYALVELNRMSEAKKELFKATKLSPYNPNYWAELGHILQTEKDWDDCIQAFEKTAESAAFFQGQEKVRYLTRAWRGIGFTAFAARN